MRIWCGLSVLVSMVLSHPVEAATRVALVGTDDGESIANILVLAGAELSKLEGVELLERQQMRRVLAEHELALSGLIDSERAIRAGQLLGVDLFCVVETDVKLKKAVGLVVFDGRSGVRVWDAAAAGGTLDETVSQLCDGLKRAVAKHRARPDQIRSVGVLTVRNADLPRSMDSTVQALGRLLERQLVQAPGVVLLERDRLRHVLKERDLPTTDPVSPLLVSLRLVELEIGRGEGGEGWKAIARITDTARHELGRPSFSAVDSYAALTGLLPLMLQTLQVEPVKNAMDRVKEADRFSRESWLRAEHREFELAAIDAEAALALDPEDLRRRVQLIRRLSDAAIELVDPGKQQYAGPPSQPVDAQKLERSIELARHGLSLEPELVRRTLANPDWPRTGADISHSAFTIYLSKIVVGQHHRELVRDFAHEYRTQQIRHLGQPLYEAAKNGRGFGEYSGWALFHAEIDFFHRYSFVFDDWSQDAVDVMTQWAPLADAQQPIRNPQTFRTCDFLLGVVRHNQRVNRLKAADLQRLRTAYQVLETQSDPMLQLHGRLLVLSLDHHANTLPRPQAIEEVGRLVARVEPLLFTDPAPPLEVRKCWFNFVGDANHLLPADDRLAANLRFHEALASHDLYSSVIFRDAGGFNEKQDSPNLVGRAIAFLEAKSGGLEETERRVELERLRKQHRKLLGTPPETVTPWTAVRTLIDVSRTETTGHCIVRPVFAGRTVYALRMSWNRAAHSSNNKVTFTLLRLDVDSRGQTSLGTFALENLPRGEGMDATDLEHGNLNVLSIIERSTTLGSYFVRSSLLADGRYYAATMGKGILAFPLDGSSPRSITAESGLPSNFVQAITCHEGLLYAWVGQPKREAYLVRLKLDGTDLHVIASSRRAVEQTPLDNVAPVQCDFLWPDVPRRRIVFRLTTSNSDNNLGLWELDFQSDRLRQLQRTQHLLSSSKPPRVVSDDRLLIQDGSKIHAFDLKTNELRLFCEHVTDPPWMFHLLTLRGDELWLGIPFGRIDLRTKRLEEFPKLRETEYFQPGFGHLLGPDELVLGDTEGLWLLKLKPPSQPEPPGGK